MDFFIEKTFIKTTFSLFIITKLFTRFIILYVLNVVNKILNILFNNT